MKKNILGMLSLSALLLAGAPAMAQPRNETAPDGPAWSKGQHRGKRHGRHGRRGGLLRHPERLQQRLGLSETQVQQLKTIGTELRQGCTSYRTQMHALRKQMRTLMQAPTVDATQVQAVAAQMRPLRQLMGEERLKARIQAMQLLTQEQRSKLVKRGRFGKRGFGKRGFGRGFGRGAAGQGRGFDQGSDQR